MKNIIIVLLLSVSMLSFSQEYIGKDKNSIRDNVFYEVDCVYIDSSDNKLTIHDLTKSSVTICYFNREICDNYIFLYYNLSKIEVYEKLNKKFSYEKGSDNWISDINGNHYEFCLTEKPGKIFIIEVCKYLANK